MLLALDTSTAAVTAAVHSGAPGTPGEVLAVETVVDARGAGEHLAPAVDRALARAGVGAGELTDIVVGTGPGPFTGLRVGIVTGRVLALTSGAGPEPRDERTREEWHKWICDGLTHEARAVQSFGKDPSLGYQALLDAVNQALASGRFAARAGRAQLPADLGLGVGAGRAADDDL